jgi:hypothetical protein
MQMTSKMIDLRHFLKTTTWARRSAPAVFCFALLLLAGCLNQQEQIGRRISIRSGFFASLPVESQQRLRKGQIRAGDRRDAAWIVYGSPDRVFKKITATSTNEVWSYVSQDVTNDDEAHAIDTSDSIGPGKSALIVEAIRTPRARVETYEYMRIEFEGDRVRAIEFEGDRAGVAK